MEAGYEKLGVHVADHSMYIYCKLMPVAFNWNRRWSHQKHAQKQIDRFVVDFIKAFEKVNQLVCAKTWQLYSIWWILKRWIKSCLQKEKCSTKAVLFSVLDRNQCAYLSYPRYANDSSTKYHLIYLLIETPPLQLNLMAAINMKICMNWQHEKVRFCAKYKFTDNSLTQTFIITSKSFVWHLDHPRSILYFRSVVWVGLSHQTCQNHNINQFVS